LGETACNEMPLTAQRLEKYNIRILLHIPQEHSCIYFLVFILRMWKGVDHPVNRFQWRRMEKAGTLPYELLQKKKTVLDYHKSRLFNQDSVRVSVEF
uniref:HAUS6 protein n=1 Tax=Angiostrongylus cantonensis TaxID=6313 RepID=A0A0K0D5S3_ANGCA